MKSHWYQNSNFEPHLAYLIERYMLKNGYNVDIAESASYMEAKEIIRYLTRKDAIFDETIDALKRNEPLPRATDSEGDSNSRTRLCSLNFGGGIGDLLTKETFTAEQESNSNTSTDGSSGS